MANNSKANGRIMQTRGLRIDAHERAMCVGPEHFGTIVIVGGARKMPGGKVIRKVTEDREPNGYSPEWWPYPDAQLMPLRAEQGEDQTLTWADRPLAGLLGEAAEIEDAAVRRATMGVVLSEMKFGTTDSYRTARHVVNWGKHAGRAA